jgi:hypothetical protein
MASFPTLSTGSTVLYPLTQSISRPAAVLQFEDGKEQRWKAHVPTSKFTLQLSEITWADVQAVLTLFSSMKGRYDATWDITIAGTTYSHLMFVDDELTWEERAEGQFTMTIPIRQARP